MSGQTPRVAVTTDTRRSAPARVTERVHQGDQVVREGGRVVPVLGDVGQPDADQMLSALTEFLAAYREAAGAMVQRGALSQLRSWAINVRARSASALTTTS
jgi:hypothetical protein